MPATKAPAPWSQPAQTVLGELDTSIEQGLSAAEVRRRLQRHGPNELRRISRRSAWRILIDQFASLIVALLAAAAAVAFVFDERLEAFAIVGVIFINATIGFVTERRALRSMEALRELGRTEATVRRGGKVERIPAGRLVPGDIVILDAGDVMSADLRVVSGSRLQADESPLTGESLPVDKTADPVDSDAALGERASMLFKGTALTRGAGEGVVVATGMVTELGQISALVETAEADTTPLEQRLERLARRLIGLTLGIAVVVAGVVLASGRGLYFAVEIAIALAVATIPEGLPIVATVALARGMWRMARRNALVEQLAAVETLGSTSVILTDKTGTLTENRMTVVELRLAEGRVETQGTGLDTRGQFHTEHGPIAPEAFPGLLEALRVGVLCSNAVLDTGPDGQPRATGDPTEVSLLVAGAKAGLTRTECLRACPEVLEIAFDPETKRMATLHDDGDRLFAAVKGAPETVLEACSTIRTATGSVALSQTDRQEWLRQAEEMAGVGERVLALATATLEHTTGEPAFGFADLELLALVGFFDPPRERVRDAVIACQAAGIRVIMVTGDHGATGWNVAAAVGLIDPAPGERPAFIDARDLPPLEELTAAEIGRIREAAVIARASPRQKLDLIALHQRGGAVVAMTGDGVNDAPALKKADIGIAMGRRGTQVAREAADMVLRDDELGTIVTAVAQGRAIFANIRKFVIYLMSCNVSEIFAVAIGALAQGPLPLLPLQILFLNLVTDVFPALALGLCAGSPALMREPPRNSAEPILTRRHWQRIFVLGAIIALAVLGALATAVLVLGLPHREATTVSFLTLALAQMWHVFAVRNPGSGWLRNEVTGNLWIWIALGLCLALLVLAVHWPPLARILSVSDPGLSGWALAFGASLLPLVAGQLELYLTRQRVAPGPGIGAHRGARGSARRGP